MPSTATAPGGELTVYYAKRPAVLSCAKHSGLFCVGQYLFRLV